MKDIIWLASYPKSGNTWFRIFLTNLVHANAPANINDLDSAYIASARLPFDEATGLEASDLTFEEIDRLRPLVYEQMAKEAKQPEFHKVHDAFTYTSDGTSLIPQAPWSRAIYIIRNPLDVAVSFANHNSTDVAKVIRQMAKSTFKLAKNETGCDVQLRQQLLSWREHVLSWTDKSGLDLLTIRYEDLQLRAGETFAKAVRFAGLSFDRAQILRAIRRSDFKNLKKQEDKNGFREKPPGCQSFFFRGKIGSWRDVLTSDQAKQIITDHGTVMARFGYLNENGEPVF